MAVRRPHHRGALIPDRPCVEGTVVEWLEDDNGTSMQYKVSRKHSTGKPVHSIVWAFDEVPCNPAAPF